MTFNTPTNSGVAPPFPDRRRQRPPQPTSQSNQLLSHFASLSLSSNPSQSSSVSPSSSSPPSSRKGVYTPLDWNTCFDSCHDISLPSRNGVWRLYTAGFPVGNQCGPPPLVLVFLHGGGHCALAWSLVAELLKPHVPVLAFDARGHGHSRTDDDTKLDGETQVEDAVHLLSRFFVEQWPNQVPSKLVLCGHSMGGAIAVRLTAVTSRLQIVGLVVIDVVEGTAMAALPYMTNWLANRTGSFASVEKAIRYVTSARYVRNIRSARISVPPQVFFSDSIGRWVWRTPLEETQQYWNGWFDGLSSLFLSLPCPKMLILANVNRLDKDLMIAQMQGKFQNILIPSAGHTVHEDQPEQTAQAVLDYLYRNLLLARQGDADDAPIYQQRRPIPPCC